jgi:hypothetical protein
MDMIWLSVKRDFFIELSPVQITRKFYLSTHRIFGGITITPFMTAKQHKPTGYQYSFYWQGENEFCVVASRENETIRRFHRWLDCCSENCLAHQ